MPILQRKLSIGAIDDPLEQEADRVAEQTLSQPQEPASPGTLPRIHRYASQAAGTATVAPLSVDQVLASTGKPLEPVLRQDMEQRFGHDFSRVRVHSDSAAEQSAKDVNANAYTVGQHIAFGAGRFAPATSAGRRLLAHELTHVVQQSANSMPPVLDRQKGNNDALAEIQGLPMSALLIRLTQLPPTILDDERAAEAVGGPRLVIAVRAVKAKNERGLVDFLTTNRRGLERLPGDQNAAILAFFATPGEGTSERTINTDLEMDVIIVAPSAINLPGQVGNASQTERKLFSDPESEPEPISSFEEGLLKDRTPITGVVLDPDTRQIIGYRTRYADGISTLVDREGSFVVDAGIPRGVESEGLGPIDYLPSPKGLVKGVAKAGAGVAGKLLVKGALKKGVAAGGKVTLGSIMKMRRIAWAIARKLTPTAEAKAFVKSVQAGAKVNTTLSVRAAEVLVKKYDKAGPSMALALSQGRMIGPYESFRVFTRGHGGAYQAHHIVETSVLEHLGHSVGQAPSIILSSAQHADLSALLAATIPKAELGNLTKKEILAAYRAAYKNYPEWIAEVERYLR